MKGCIGIRQENAYEAEQRAPLAPDHVANLVREHGLRVIVEPSDKRCFSDAEYEQAGAELSADLSPCAGRLRGQGDPAGEHPRRPGLLRLLAHHGRPPLDDADARPDPGPRVHPDRLRAGADLARPPGHLLRPLRRLRRDDRRPVGARPAPRVGGRREPRSPRSGRPSSTRASQRRSRRSRRSAPGSGATDCRRPPRRWSSASRARATWRGARCGSCSTAADGQAPARGARRLLPRRADSRTASVYSVQFRQRDLYEPIEPGREFDWSSLHRRPESYRNRFERFVPFLSVLVNGIHWDTGYPASGDQELPALALREPIRDRACG